MVLRRIAVIAAILSIAPACFAAGEPIVVYYVQRPPFMGHDADGKLVGYDIEQQCRQVFANVRAVLEASGARWEQLVDVTVFLTDMARDFPVYNRLYAEYFKGIDACRTTLGITALPTPIAIELKCIAALPSADG